MPVGILNTEMPLGIEHLHLELLTFPFRRTEIVKAVNRNLFGRGFHMSAE
jgi:hypothetical protein